MTPEQEAAIRSLHAEATPGPWLRHTYGHKDGRSQLQAVAKALRGTREATGHRMTDLTWVEYENGTICLVGNGPRQTENGDFIANAYDSIPLLLEALDAARADAERLAEALRDTMRELRHWVDEARKHNPGWIDMGYEPYLNKPSLALGTMDAEAALTAHEEATK